MKRERLQGRLEIDKNNRDRVIVRTSLTQINPGQSTDTKKTYQKKKMFPA